MSSSIVDIPKITILHGVPVISKDQRAEFVARLRELNLDRYVVAESQRAAAKWGCGSAIPPGFKSTDWPLLPKMARVLLAPIPPHPKNAMDERRIRLKIKASLARLDIIACQLGDDYIAPSRSEYRDFISRSLLYIDPSPRSASLRGCLEAMCGGCYLLGRRFDEQLSALSQSLLMLPDSADDIALLVEDLVSRPSQAIAIGQAARVRTLDVFSWTEFSQRWNAFLGSAVSQVQPEAAI
jgi:glycosyltransferase involved in cell wall biosynthesis